MTALNDQLSNQVVRLSDDLPYVIRRLPLSQLHLDMRYQRPIADRWLKHLTLQFSPAAAGFLIVNIRHDGTLYVIDGQHRMMAMIGQAAAGKPAITHWYCMVYSGLSLEEEATIFADTNTNRTIPSRYAIIKARLVAGDPQTLLIVGTLEKFGLAFAPNNGSNNPREIRAIGTIERIVAEGGITELAQVLSLVQSHWEGELHALDQIVLKGLHYFLQRYPEVDLATLNQVLHDKPLMVLVQQARAAYDWHQFSDAMQFARQVLILVNLKRSHTHQLPERFIGWQLSQTSSPR